jgi:hypothetical protein
MEREEGKEVRNWGRGLGYKYYFGGGLCSLGADNGDSQKASKFVIRSSHDVWQWWFGPIWRGSVVVSRDICCAE